MSSQEGKNSTNRDDSRGNFENKLKSPTAGSLEQYKPNPGATGKDNIDFYAERADTEQGKKAYQEASFNQINTVISEARKSLEQENSKESAIKQALSGEIGDMMEPKFQIESLLQIFDSKDFDAAVEYSYINIEKLNAKGKDNLSEKDQKELKDSLQIVEMAGMPHGMPEIQIFPDTVHETVSQVVSIVEGKLDNLKSELNNEGSSDVLQVIQKTSDTFEIGISNMRESLMEIIDNPELKKALVMAMELGVGTYLISEISKKSSNPTLLAAELMAGFAATMFYINNPDKRSPLLERVTSKINELDLENIIDGDEERDNINNFNLLTPPLWIKEKTQRLAYEVFNPKLSPWEKGKKEDFRTPLSERDIIDEKTGNVIFTVDNSKKYYEYSIGRHYMFAIDPNDMTEPQPPTMPSNISNDKVREKYEKELEEYPVRREIWERELNTIDKCSYIIGESDEVLKNEKFAPKIKPYEKRMDAVDARDVKRRAAQSSIAEIDLELDQINSKSDKGDSLLWTGYKNRLETRINMLNRLLSPDGAQSLIKEAERIGTNVTDKDKQRIAQICFIVIPTLEMSLTGNLPKAIIEGIAASVIVASYFPKRLENKFKERTDSLGWKYAKTETKGLPTRLLTTTAVTAAVLFLAWAGATQHKNNLFLGFIGDPKANTEPFDWIGHTKFGLISYFSNDSDDRPKTPIAGTADMPPADTGSYKNEFINGNGNTLLSKGQEDSLGKNLNNDEERKRLSEEKAADDKLPIEQNAGSMFTIIVNEAKLPKQFQSQDVEALIKKFSEPNAVITTDKEKKIMAAIVNNSKNFPQYFQSLSAKEITTLKNHIDSLKGQVKQGGQVDVSNAINKIMNGQGITEDEAKNIFEKMYTK